MSKTGLLKLQVGSILRPPFLKKAFLVACEIADKKTGNGRSLIQKAHTASLPLLVPRTLTRTHIRKDPTTKTPLQALLRVVERLEKLNESTRNKRASEASVKKWPFFLGSVLASSQKADHVSTLVTKSLTPTPTKMTNLKLVRLIKSPTKNDHFCTHSQSIPFTYTHEVTEEIRKNRK